MNMDKALSISQDLRKVGYQVEIEPDHQGGYYVSAYLAGDCMMGSASYWELYDALLKGHKGYE